MMVSRMRSDMIFRLISAGWLALVGPMVVCGNWSPAAAQVAEPKRFDLRIENNRLSGDLKVIRVRRGDVVEINWSANLRTVLHLHGYDIETTVEPAKIMGVLNRLGTIQAGMIADMDIIHDHTVSGPLYRHRPNGVPVVTTNHGPFVPELVAGLQPKLPINGTDQIFSCVVLASAPGTEHGGDLFFRER